MIFNIDTLKRKSQTFKSSQPRSVLRNSYPVLVIKKLKSNCKGVNFVSKVACRLPPVLEWTPSKLFFRAFFRTLQSNRNIQEQLFIEHWLYKTLDWWFFSYPMFPWYKSVFHCILGQINLNRKNILLCASPEQFLFPFKTERFAFQVVFKSMSKF